MSQPAPSADAPSTFASSTDTSQGENATLVTPAKKRNPPVEASECCLVQIYPADVVDGMLLLEEPVLTIGRSEDCTMCLPDSSVSRRHGELRRTKTGFTLVDTGSTNGVLVNGQRTDEYHLQAGDTIQIGCYMFKFLSAGSVESQYHETVYSAMTRDALTGTMNKRYLLEAMQREVAHCVRRKDTLSVVMLDIDFFKSVNDTQGHLVGDEVLREFGRRVSSICRADDLLARYGGEEFCAVLFGSNLDEALGMAERCRAIVADSPFDTAAGPLAITASFGVAVLDQSKNEGPLDLINRADLKLYDAKNAGRNRVEG